MIRKLLLADAESVLRLRREALEREPLAFSSSPAEDRVQLSGALEAYLAHPAKAIFGAFEPDLVGMAGIAQEEGAKSSHKARLWGVYVAPARRGKGIGRALVEAAIQFAGSLAGVTHVHLAVAESGQEAQALYGRLGFRTWGTEPMAIRVGEASVAEHHMMLELDRSEEVISVLRAYLQEVAELEPTAQTLFRLWRDEGWGTWLEAQSLPQAQRVRADALMARLADLMGQHREGK